MRGKKRALLLNAGSPPRTAGALGPITRVYISCSRSHRVGYGYRDLLPGTQPTAAGYINICRHLGHGHLFDARAIRSAARTPRGDSPR